MANNQQQYHYQTPPQTPPPSRPAPMPPRPVAPIRVTKNKFLTFVFALIPGAGQMYHGLYKKGTSLMLLFWGIIALSLVTYFTAINFLLPVIWFYSFFDAVNRMNMPVDEMKMLKDDYFLFGSWTKSSDGRPQTLKRFVQQRHIVIGVAFIVLAVWIFFNNLFGTYYGYTIMAFLPEEAFYFIRAVIRSIPVLVIPAICIIIGANLIGLRKKKEEPEFPQNDVSFHKEEQ